MDSLELRTIQAEQSDLDVKCWPHSRGRETIYQTGLQLTQLAGKLATIAEILAQGDIPDWEVLDKEVIPDLLIVSARLANDRKVSLGGAFNARLAELTKHFSETDNSQD